MKVFLVRCKQGEIRLFSNKTKAEQFTESHNKLLETFRLFEIQDNKMLDWAIEAYGDNPWCNSHAEYDAWREETLKEMGIEGVYYLNAKAYEVEEMEVEE